MLNDELSGHEQIDEALLITRQIFDASLIGGDLLSIDAKARKKFVPKSVFIGALSGRKFPILAESRSAGAHLFPIQTHLYPLHPSGLTLARRRAKEKGRPSTGSGR